MEVSDVVRDWSQNANAANQWNNAAKNFGRHQNDYGNSATNAANKAQAAGSDYGNQASNWDQSNAATNRAANKAAANAAAANRWAQRNDANRFANDQVWTQGNAFRQGRRKNDDIDYAYDKKFDLRDSINGGFEYGEKSDSHALDDFRDRAAAYDRNVDKAAARAAAADAQSADQKAASFANAAASDANWDKFARNADSVAKANGRDRDWAQKLDTSQGGNRLWSDARKTASDIYKDLATGDFNYDRVGKGLAGGAGRGVGGGSPYAYGVAGVGGYAAKPGAYYPGYAGDYAKAAGIKDAERKWDQAAATKLRQGDLASTQDVTKADYRRDNWLNDRNKGFDRNQVSKANDAGFSDWARQNARTANAADAKSADAASKWARDQANAKFNEDLWKKEAERKRLSDRKNDKKVWNNYYQNKRKGGDDWERLNYDRNENDDIFGFNTAQKKDWAQGAKDNRWNEAFDANQRNAQVARAAEAARNAQNNDWRKNAQGWQNARAAAQNNAAASKNGRTNGAWKQDVATAANDAKLQNQRVADAAGNRNAVDARAFNGAFGGVTAGRGLYPGGIAGYGGYGAYPAGGYYAAGYPGAGYGYKGYY
nr:hypothetical protein BaRGS_013310 [Batillaria attramentaria]